MNLVVALAELAKCQDGPAVMEDALTCMRNAIEVYQQAGESYWLPIAQGRVTAMQAELDALKR